MLKKVGKSIYFCLFHTYLFDIIGTYERGLKMATKITLPNKEDVVNFPVTSGAVMICANSKIRVVVRKYYWDQKKQRGLEKREYLGYVVDNQFYSNEDYKNLFNNRGVKRLVPLKKNAEQNTSVPSSDTSKSSFNSLIGSLETRLAAENPLYYAVAEQIGLIEDLTLVWGKERAEAILSVAFHWLHTSNNASYLYESWSEGRLLPYPEPISSKELSSLFASLTEVNGWRKTFFNQRVKRLNDHEMLSFDATNIATEAQEITYAQYGKGKEGGYQKQVGLILLVGHESKMPVLFRLLPGNITDVTTVQDMLFRFDELDDKRRVFAAVVDRGYFSLDNIASFIDHKSRVVMAANTNNQWIKDAMESSMHHMWMNEARIAGKKCWGWTVPVEKKFNDGVKRKCWVHIYRSDAKSHQENTAFYQDLEQFEEQWLTWKSDDLNVDRKTCPLLKSSMMKFFKSTNAIPGQTPLEQDHDAIDAATRYFGFFANVTTMECTARQALIDYSDRDLIEKTFKAGKTAIDLDTLRSHDENTLEGRLIVSFVAMSILSKIYCLMKQETEQVLPKGKIKKEKPLFNEMTFNELKNRLSTARIVYDGKGQCQWMEITKRQHDIARRMGFPDLYKEIPSWVVR